MKRLVIITVGKTHSGKTTFARDLEKELNNSFVMDQDNHAEFINSFYKKLQPKQGPNTLKHAISKIIVDYAKEHTDFHLIICNSNRTQKGRLYLLEELFNKDEFVRILVHFDIPDDVLQEVQHNLVELEGLFANQSDENWSDPNLVTTELEDVLNGIRLGITTGEQLGTLSKIDKEILEK